MHKYLAKQSNKTFRTISWNDYTVPLGHSEDMSMHVTTCTSYDFNTLISVVRKLQC